MTDPTPQTTTPTRDEAVLREICEELLDKHHGRQAPGEVDAPSFGRGAAAGWDAAVSAFYKRALASLSPAATPVSEAGGEPDMRRVCEALGFDPTNHHNAAKCPYCNPDQADAPKLTYRSTQATTCASCGEHKHTPLRRDEMGGYVCLTCIDKRLAALAKPASSPAGGDSVALRNAAEEFCRRVEAGEIRSKRSYAAFKAALAKPAGGDVSELDHERWRANAFMKQRDRIVDRHDTVREIVAKMRADMEKLGGFENGMLAVPADGVRSYIEQLEAAISGGKE